jgi:calcineurin-like phosphoesterase family protein
MSSILSLENRPFSDVFEMNRRFVSMCEALGHDDIIVHAGDLACFRSENGLDVRPSELLKGVKASFVNVRGNHDVSNKVKSACDSMTTRLGRHYPNVVVGHYPSYDPRAKDYARDGWICLCGHVHGKWKHCLDLNRQCLNVNVGVDAWGYSLVSEDDLCRYIGKLLTHRPDDLYRCFLSKGKLVFQGEKGETR